MSLIMYVNPETQVLIDQLKNTTEADAKSIVDFYIDSGVKSSLIVGGMIFGLFQYWYYTSLRTIAKIQRELEETYMGPEIIAPRAADPAI